MLLLVTSIKLISEIALLSFTGRWVLAALIGHLAPHGQGSNPFLWVLDALCRPFVKASGWISPRFVSKHHHPLVAFLLLMLTWGVATFFKIALCLNAGVQHCS